MATVSKIYTISIQMDAAQQALDAAIKKLDTLDKSLEGVSRDGAIGQGIVKEMAAAAAEVEKLQTKVQGFEQGLDKLVPLVPGSVGALRQEVIELEASLETSVVGSAELATAIQQLGDKKSQLRELANAVNAANPRAQARAFTIFSQAVVGAFTTATVAAQTFGLSSETAEKYQAKLQGLIGVLFSVEQISKALNGENIALGKSILASAKGWLGFGEAAQAGSKAARAALISTGIGVALVALAALYALWQDFGTSVKGSESKFTAFKATVVGGLQALWAITKDFYIVLWKLVTFDFPGALEAAKKSGHDVATAYAEGRAGVIDEARRAEIAHEVELTSRYLDVLKGRGTDVLALEVANAKRKLEAQKQGSKEQLDAVRDYLVLKEQLEKRADDEHKAARLQFLTGLAGAESARGADNFAQQRAAKLEQIAQLRQAELDGEHVTQAQKLQLLNEYDDLLIAHDKVLAEKRRALRMAVLNGELAILEAGGREQLTRIGNQAQDENTLALRSNSQKLRIAAQVGADLRAQAQVDWAAVKANEVEQYTLGVERARLYAQQQAQAVAEGASLRKKVEDALLNSADRRAKFLEIDPQAVAMAKRSVQRASDEVAADIESRRMAAEARADIGGNLLIKVFGLTDAQAQETKKKLSEMYQAVGQLTATYFAGASAEADQQITETQNRLQLLTQQYSDAQQKVQTDEEALKDATGARRDYLIKKLQQERAETERLASAKAEATRKEEAAQKRKAQLDKEQQIISAASTAIESTLLAIKAGQAIAEAGKDGKFGIDNIIYAVTMTAAMATGILAMRNAVKYADGGAVGSDGVLRGPSHRQGGIPFTVSGVPGFEAEGGEGILPVDATSNNAAAFELLRTKGRKKTLTLNDFAEIGQTSVQPPPVGHFAAGGVLGVGRASVGAPAAGQVLVAGADFSALVANSAAMLAHLQSISVATGKTAGHTEELRDKPPLVIGPYEAQRIEQERQKGEQAERFAAL